MKQADRMKTQAASADPVRERGVKARAGRPEKAAPSGFQDKDLRIPNTTLAQLARALLRGSSTPRPENRKPQGAVPCMHTEVTSGTHRPASPQSPDRTENGRPAAGWLGTFFSLSCAALDELETCW